MNDIGKTSTLNFNNISGNLVMSWFHQYCLKKKLQIILSVFLYHNFKRDIQNKFESVPHSIYTNDKH